MCIIGKEEEECRVSQLLMSMRTLGIGLGLGSGLGLGLALVFG